MTRYQAFRAAQSAGHVFWWVFIVAAMLGRGITWFSSSEPDDFIWNPYAPLTDVPRRYADYTPSDGFEQMSAISLAGICLLVVFLAVAIRETWERQFAPMVSRVSARKTERNCVLFGICVHSPTDSQPVPNAQIAADQWVHRLEWKDPRMGEQFETSEVPR